MPNPFYAKTRKEWREWLEIHFQSHKEIWLVFPKVSSSKSRISYNDAVEEALCFGWIDSTVKSYDEQSHIQRFTPRNPKSSYSQSNKERIKWLYEHKLIHSSVTNSIEFIIHETFDFPVDIMNELKKDNLVWENFNKFPEGYKRIRVAYIDNARIRPEEFTKRLRSFIEKTRLNKMIKGHGGIDKYYK